ncbi:MAG: NUDIX domain-containing protein [Acidobacteriota bacterium]|nr:NUDIX domain-containing protein [Blastocatellia bacterium]MDQ3220044.1 NUDIX domain-containing protein [Acidobacteriota bacterium]MDQ3491141.1 NUDIX domain-containing protein [Acidobacteriota bacterium]
MITKLTGVVWKILSWKTRKRIVRLTQSKFTVSVAAVIVNSKGEVLLLNHVLRAYSGWGLPGGFINHGEQPEEGIRREIREETGIELESPKLLRVRIVNTHVEILFTATAIGKPEVKSNEIIGLGWFALESLPEKMGHEQKLIIEKVLNE